MTDKCDKVLKEMHEISHVLGQVTERLQNCQSMVTELRDEARYAGELLGKTDAELLEHAHASLEVVYESMDKPKPVTDADINDMVFPRTPSPQQAINDTQREL